jgi:hypothetical protein
MTNYIVLQFYILVEAKVLQIKEDPKTNEKLFYVHFLNYEKRMDKWVSEQQVKKNLGNMDKDLDGVR